jgi:arylsulfatase A-like enzyme
MNRPNVLVVIPHDLGDFLPAYGTPVAAPSSQRLAAGGVVLSNHFSTGTVSSPSRSCFMTGCYPHTTGMMGLVHRGWTLDADRFPTIPMRMREAGWQTCLFGGQHEHLQPAKLGYDLVRLPGERGAKNHIENGVDDAVEWLRSGAARKKPFFLSLGSGEVHRFHRMGEGPSGWDRDVYEFADPAEVAVPPWMPHIPEIRLELAQFYGAVRHLDAQVGRVLDALDETGLAANTIVVWTTDHGASFLHGKASLYDGGTKTACIWRWPEGLPAGGRCTALTSHVDVMATLAELCGFEPPGLQQGTSFAAQLRGSPGGRGHVFAEKNYTNYYDPGRFARSERFKYIRKGLATCVFDFVIPEIEQSHADFRKTRELFEFYPPERSREELYDLEADPGELRNLAGEPGSAADLAAMRAALDDHLEKTDDPFRHLANDLPMQADGYARVAEFRRGK